jgi:hypothetical protein
VKLWSSALGWEGLMLESASKSKSESVMAWRLASWCVSMSPSATAPPRPSPSALGGLMLP